MSEFDLTDDIPVDEPQPPEPEEYEPDAPVSPETGTVYETTGEPEVTPHDEELVKDDQE